LVRAVKRVTAYLKKERAWGKISSLAAKENAAIEVKGARRKVIQHKGLEAALRKDVEN
jgi:hypothetical protein